ncbi:MAG TPA: hypothetical protein PKC28_00145 [Bdellovibrionales bacterium]|nr:hypothetical protein [Bdellovibrionales bacterium]
MKLFSWLNDLKTPSIDGDNESDGEPSLSPVLQERMTELEKMTVREAMVPRAVVTALDADVQLRRVRRLKSAKVAFFPVYKGDLDHILGWISKSKVLELLAENSEDNNLEAFLKPVGAVREDASVADLADIFLKAASPFLVVKNAQGTTTGIMRLADFVELIFGFELSPTLPASPAESNPLRSYEL